MVGRRGGIARKGGRAGARRGDETAIVRLTVERKEDQGEGRTSGTGGEGKEKGELDEERKERRVRSLGQEVARLEGEGVYLNVEKGLDSTLSARAKMLRN